MSRWPTREVMALHWQPRRRSVAQRLRKRATQTDHQRLARVKGRSTIECDRHACAGPSMAGRGIPKGHRSGVSGLPYAPTLTPNKTPLQLADSQFNGVFHGITAQECGIGRQASTTSRLGGRRAGLPGHSDDIARAGHETRVQPWAYCSAREGGRMDTGSDARHPAGDRHKAD